MIQKARAQAKEAVKLLNKNGIFTQTMFIIGERKDSARSIEPLRRFVDDLDSILAIFVILSSFPGTEVFKEARQNGWIDDWNWANHGVVHVIVPTESLPREESQEEHYKRHKKFLLTLGVEDRKGSSQERN